eukprot:c17727_g1_i2 orf=140-502(+)
MWGRGSPNSGHGLSLGGGVELDSLAYLESPLLTGFWRHPGGGDKDSLRYLDRFGTLSSETLGDRRVGQKSYNLIVPYGDSPLEQLWDFYLEGTAGMLVLPPPHLLFSIDTCFALHRAGIG